MALTFTVCADVAFDTGLEFEIADLCSVTVLVDYAFHALAVVTDCIEATAWLAGSTATLSLVAAVRRPDVTSSVVVGCCAGAAAGPGVFDFEGRIVSGDTLELTLIIAT